MHTADSFSCGIPACLEDVDLPQVHETSAGTRNGLLLMFGRPGLLVHNWVGLGFILLGAWSLDARC